jgi:hypothetical protein
VLPAGTSSVAFAILASLYDTKTKAKMVQAAGDAINDTESFFNTVFIKQHSVRIRPGIA